MARILFTWELGEGNGHIVPHYELLSSLVKRGDQVYFAAKNLSLAVKILEPIGVNCIQAPIHPIISKKEQIRVYTYANLLNNIGYYDKNIILGMIYGWYNLYKILKPQLIIFDHSPTALLASKDLKIKRILYGLGFYTPPETYPLENMNVFQKLNKDQRIIDEKRLITQINHSIKRINFSPLKTVSEIFKTDSNIFRTYKELDHYPTRPLNSATYLGLVGSPTIGYIPKWPKGSKRIFAYLKPCKALPEILYLLKKFKISTLVVCNEINLDFQKNHRSPYLYFSTKLYDQLKILNDCELTITNGTGTATESLLAGKPVLMLPTNLEQLMTAYRVQEIGAGLYTHASNPDKLESKLKILLETDSYKINAINFSSKYSKYGRQVSLEKMIKIVDDFVN
tara:strand:+ start:1083 stop:2270 length:1188 start_codon:yes stop_codon:yes gene_type:complete